MSQKPDELFCSKAMLTFFVSLMQLSQFFNYLRHSPLQSTALLPGFAEFLLLTVLPTSFLLLNNLSLLWLFFSLGPDYSK